MRHALALHPDSVSDAVTGIDVDVVSNGGVLGLRYVVAGDMERILLPPPAPSRQADGLWRHSCFEAFFGEEAGGAYAELNVSPSTEWGAYRFAGYRSGMKDANLPPPRVEVERGDGRFELRVALKLRPGAGNRRLGLSAVIEETSGNLSYWALAHPPGAPDFHHADCFAIKLPPLG